PPPFAYWPSDSPILEMLVEPVAPNISATPYRKKAVANEPSRKYLTDDSLLIADRRRKPARMYVAIEEISSAMKISTNSIADDISIMPTAPKRISPEYSPARICCNSMYS